MVPSILNFSTKSEDQQQQNNIENVNRLIFSLQVLEILAPSLHKSLLPPVMECLPRLCQMLAHLYKAVRHMASRCIAVLATLDKEEVRLCIF